MRDAENIREVEALGIDLMGFIFWPDSKRYISKKPEDLPVSCKRVGVFVDESTDTVRHIADDYALDMIQLHGSESPEYAQKLHEWKVIKAFNIATTYDLAQTANYEGHADYFVLTCSGDGGIAS